MSNHKLETLGVVSLLAGEFFLVHPNIEHQKYPWILVIVGWVISAIASGWVADKIYNLVLPGSNQFIRYSALISLSAIIFGIFFIAGKIFY